MPLDTGKQVECTVGQTDDHSSPYHTIAVQDLQDSFKYFSCKTEYILQDVSYGDGPS